MSSWKIDASSIPMDKAEGLLKTLNFEFEAEPKGGIQDDLIEGVINTAGSGISQQAFGVGRFQQDAQILAPRGVPIGMGGTRPPHEFTLGAGLSAGVAIVVGFTKGAGVYGCNNGQVGTYTSSSLQAMTNMGGSGGVEVTIVFGPPSTFSGMSWALGLDIDAAPPFCVGGRMLFSYPDKRWIGMSMTAGVGISALPLNITLELGKTNITPRFR